MRRPNATVLAVFVLVTLIGGSNFVAVRLSNRELAPFWGAGLRFAIAGALLLAYSLWRHIPLPLGPALPGVALFGILNFGVTYALAYWGLLHAPAAVAATLVALVPLLTFFLTVALRIEHFRWSAVGGGAISLAGVAIIFADQLSVDVPFDSLIALFLQAVGIASIRSGRTPWPWCPARCCSSCSPSSPASRSRCRRGPTSCRPSCTS